MYVDKHKTMQSQLNFDKDKKTLPFEIIEKIIVKTENPLNAVYVRSTFCYSKMKKLFFHEERKEKFLDFVVISNNASDILWILHNNLETLYNVIVSLIQYGNDDFFIKVVNQIPNIKQNIAEWVFDDICSYLFNLSVLACSTVKIQFFLQEKFKPEQFNSLGFSKKCHDILIYLACVLDKYVIFVKDTFSFAMESDNIIFLKIAQERMKNIDVHKFISSRDITIAAYRGSLECLQWYHAKCHCNPSYNGVCILNDDIYNTAQRGKQKHVIDWLHSNTNCALKYRGYPMVGYFYDYQHFDEFWFP